VSVNPAAVSATMDTPPIPRATVSQTFASVIPVTAGPAALSRKNLMEILRKIVNVAKENAETGGNIVQKIGAGSTYIDAGMTLHVTHWAPNTDTIMIVNASRDMLELDPDMIIMTEADINQTVNTFHVMKN